MISAPANSGTSAAQSRRSTREVLTQAIEKLASCGIATPSDDARRLLTHALNCSASTLPLIEAIDEHQNAAFDGLIAQRARRLPVSYITGFRDFFKHRFVVSADVLDPRPESETLVDAALAATPCEQSGYVLDLGVGSGCLLLSVLAERPLLTGVGTDISAAALDIARQNAQNLGLDDRTDYIQCDWTSGVHGYFNLILCNPPYISKEDAKRLAPEISWEPIIALTPGGDGLAAYRALARECRAVLTSDGVAFFEFGCGQGRDVATIFEEAGWKTTLRPDLDGRDRVLEARLAM
jgi:release factor glutamine methyltransferase